MVVESIASRGQTGGGSVFLRVGVTLGNLQAHIMAIPTTTNKQTNKQTYTQRKDNGL